jgi:hypothetical protein
MWVTAGPATCRNASWCVDRRARRPLARRAAAPGIAGGGDERMAQRARADLLAQPGTTSDACTIRPAQCRPIHAPSGRRKIGPSRRFADARSIARAVRGASGMVTILPPLRRTVRVRCPRSMPNLSMSAPSASETRSPLIANSEINACSAGVPARRRPAARRPRCDPARPRATRSPAAVGVPAPPASAREDPPRPRTGRTRPRN